MGIQTGTTAILYNPEANNWPARKWAIYLRQVQKDELENFIDIVPMRVRDPALITPGVVTRNVRSRTRRRYPGGPAIQVSAHTRSVVTGPSIKLQAYPGRPITLERPRDGSDFDPDNADVPMKILQITLEGKFQDFYTYCQANKEIDFILRTNHGRPIFIGSPPPGP